ncbi:MAG: patatin-like phospholipase family protein [Robiginitomaculum sp.]|nr:patatin-like phospholipase family protein [Robiginitomaculum sp.]
MTAKSEKFTPAQLAQISILVDAPAGALRALAQGGKKINLAGGKVLFEPGDIANHVYFVKSGVLGAFHRAVDGELELLGYIRSGEPVGEMAFLGAVAHASAIYALRDAQLVKISRPVFDKLVAKYPALLRALAGKMVERMRSNRHSKANERSQPKVFAMLASSPTIDCQHLARELAKKLTNLGKTITVIGPDAATNSLDWFDQQEQIYDVVFLYTPIADNDWFRLCMRQADRLWVIGRADAVPSNPLLPVENSPARAMRMIDVILLHHPNERTISTGQDWKQAAGADRIFHWRTGNQQDVGRIARTAAGRSVGLVLSGGGARAYAHIGAVRALREAKIPIDFCGGTSMGAIIAANVAMGWDDEQIEACIYQAFVTSNPVDDYILPVVSLTGGTKVKRRLERYFGDTQIENMELPFFCLSSNLTSGRSSIHRLGLLRQALGASIALPGILPPVVIDDQVHVDGGVLNNFPVDVMQDSHRGPVLGVDVTRVRGLEAKPFVDPPGFFKWVWKYGFREPPPIASVLMRSATLATSNLDVRRSHADILILPEMEDVDLRDWKAFDKSTEAGYIATVKALEAGLLDELS